LPRISKPFRAKEYKNATVSRIEPDGIVLKSKSAITKLCFTELPKDVQERFHYDSARGAHFTADREATAAQKMERSQNILLAQPLINSLADMERHKIRPVSTRISPCCKKRFITLMTIKGWRIRAAFLPPNGPAVRMD
jgi:hypothetical protein